MHVFYCIIMVQQKRSKQKGAHTTAKPSHVQNGMFLFDVQNTEKGVHAKVTATNLLYKFL